MVKTQEYISAKRLFHLKVANGNFGKTDCLEAGQRMMHCARNIEQQADAYYWMSVYLSNIGKFDYSKVLILRALSVTADCPEKGLYFLQLAELEMHSGDFSSAAKNATNSVALMPEYEEKYSTAYNKAAELMWQAEDQLRYPSPSWLRRKWRGLRRMAAALSISTLGSDNSR